MCLSLLYGCQESTQILTLSTEQSSPKSIIPRPSSLRQGLIYPRLAWDLLCSRGWSWTLNSPPMCWDYSLGPPCLVYAELEVKPMASRMLVKYLPIELYPGPLVSYSKLPLVPELWNCNSTVLLGGDTEASEGSQSQLPLYHIQFTDHKKQCWKF